jgi:hypothetical protein
MQEAYEVSMHLLNLLLLSLLLSLLILIKVDNDDSQELWDYFLLMGHDTLPIVTLPYMEAFLTHTNSGTNADDSEYRGTNFIYCWEVSGHIFFGQWEDNTW